MKKFQFSKGNGDGTISLGVFWYFFVTRGLPLLVVYIIWHILTFSSGRVKAVFDLVPIVAENVQILKLHTRQLENLNRKVGNISNGMENMNVKIDLLMHANGLIAVDEANLIYSLKGKMLDGNNLNKKSRGCEDSKKSK